MASKTLHLKVTKFVGRASGDCECFCFDKRAPQQQLHDDSLSTHTRVKRADAARIYPNDLIPKNVPQGAIGEWRITVEFTEATENGGDPR